MKIEPDQSVYDHAHLTGDTLHLTTKQFTGFGEGVNKPEEYSWFYLIALSGQAGERVTLKANYPSTIAPQFTRQTGLAFSSTDGWQWQPISGPVHTDASGLIQHYQWEFPTTGTYILSNTMFFDYQRTMQHLRDYAREHQDICHPHTIGKSLGGRDLTMITFNATKTSRGRVLLTTGCHPAEPDTSTALDILDYLATDQAATLRQHYDIDVLPLQNPDGAANHSNLTDNGINLYWNFRKDDQENCPEAYYLWQYITQHPPVLYLDFHAYVHQHHRPPMPYLKSLTCYQGHRAKRLVRAMDHRLIRQTKGFFKIGTISMWPDALSTHITDQFNTIAYTKYHVNLNEGLTRSQQRSRAVFRALTELLLTTSTTASDILRAPHGTAKPDHTDTPIMQKAFHLRARLMQAYVYLKLYTRKYLRRHH